MEKPSENVPTQEPKEVTKPPQEEEKKEVKEAPKEVSKEAHKDLDDDMFDEAAKDLNDGEKLNLTFEDDKKLAPR